MKSKKVTLLIVLSVLILAFCVNAGMCQDKGKNQSPPEGPKTTIEGKIVFLKSFGGYMVMSKKPRDEYKIVNENAKILGELAKQGKVVKVEGRLPRGAYFLFIEKIDGKEYQGGK
jgi:hypothetical protein